jgi:subtilisin family serine protease
MSGRTPFPRSLGAKLGAAAAACALGLLAPRAQAQLDLAAALRSLARGGGSSVPRALSSSADGRVAVLAEYGSDSGVNDLLVGGRYRPLWLSPEELQRFSRDQPEVKLHWAPPRHVLLDVADGWVGGRAFREQLGFTGKGVVVGIVDTGVDVAHGDLRTKDGASRVRYLIDFSRPPARIQSDLEEEYGCTDETECAIFDNEDIDELLDNGVTGDEPRDPFGHGTHVTSLAAGNGLSMTTPRYIGIAPEAEIFGARVSRSGDGSIFDADIITATRFIFEQAERLGMPAVVNLSLGSDFGTHDGTSALEQGLASFVGPDHPGRAIVVAAGNSGALYSGTGSGEPEPLGIHTEVHVPRESPVEVPIVTPTAAQGATPGATVYVWLGTRAGDEVSVGVDREGKSWIPDVPPGVSTTYEADGYEGTVFNGPTDSKSSIKVSAANAVVIIDGSFTPGTRFTLRLSGHGSVNLWLQTNGGASPDVSTGALVPRGQKQGTINIPASHPDLIAVGATVNRNRWRDHTGQPFLVGQSDGSDNLAEIDGTAVFSAAGPNAVGVMKPDLVAPGMYVIGAMSSLADPRKNGGSGVFASQGRCGDPDYECFVTDDQKHAVTSGTSMSAPLVSGAIALLLEGRPELTQPQLRTLLQAGSRQPTGPILAEQQVGPGSLDLRGTLAVLAAELSPLDRVPTSKSRIALAASFIHPDPNLLLNGLLELRDDSDQVADVSDLRSIELAVSGGSLASGPVRIGPGLLRFSVSAPAGSGGRKLGLKLAFEGRELVSRTLAIGTDPWAAEGTPVARGGCGIAGRSSDASAGILAALLGLTWMRGRRYRRSARTAPRRDRTGALGPRRRR